MCIFQSHLVLNSVHRILWNRLSFFLFDSMNAKRKRNTALPSFRNKPKPQKVRRINFTFHLNFNVVHFFNHCPFFSFFFSFPVQKKMTVLLGSTSIVYNQYNQHCHFTVHNQKKAERRRSWRRRKTMIQTGCHWMESVRRRYTIDIF